MSDTDLIVVRASSDIVVRLSAAQGAQGIQGDTGPQGAPGANGSMAGPVSSTDNAIARFDGSGGTTVQNSVVTVGDTGNMAGVGTLNTHTIPGGTGTLRLTSDTTTLTGDVTGTGATSFAATIANDAVTYAKMQNVSATDKILGRSTAGAGDVEEIACTAAGRALIDDADAPAQRATLSLTPDTDIPSQTSHNALKSRANFAISMFAG